MTRPHTHPCVVPGCADRVPCSGYAIGSDYERDLHCSREEDSTPIRCEWHQSWHTCDWCGAWFDPADGQPRYANVCGALCADEMDEAQPLVPTEATVLRRGAGL